MSTDRTTQANKKSQGRRKMEMKLIKKKSSRMVTFSKRRVSLFRKASELSTVCGAHVAIMIFSPGGKIYSFGHPSLGAVVERYESASTRTNLTIAASQPASDHQYLSNELFIRLRAENTQRLKMELQLTLDAIEAKKKRIQKLNMAWEREHNAKIRWWNAPIEEMDLETCKALGNKLMALKITVELAEMNGRRSKKDLTTQAKIVTTHASVGDIGSNHHPASVTPTSCYFVPGWINSAAARSQKNLYMPPGPNTGSYFRGCSTTGFYKYGICTNNDNSPYFLGWTGGTGVSRGLSAKNSDDGPSPSGFNPF